MINTNEAASQFDNKSLDLALLALEELASRKSDELKVYTQKDFSKFCNAIIAQDDQLQIDIIENLIKKGISLETIYEILIPETAENLGDLWKKDKLSFVEVNIGSQRLHRLTRIYENRYLGPMYLGTDGPNILMILPDGEIHTLGLITASGIFKKYGANPYIAVGYKLADIISLIESKPFKIVGISVSNTENLDNAVEIAGIIKSSIKQKIPLILGGHSIKTNKIKKARLKVFDLVTANPEEVLTAYDVQ